MSASEYFEPNSKTAAKFTLKPGRVNVLHPRLIVTTLACNLFFGIAHGDDHSASSFLITPVAGPSEDISATHEDFSCATRGEVADDVVTVRTTLAGVPAIVRVPKALKKPPIVLWHGIGPPASESELMKALPLDDVPSIKVYLGLPLFGARAPSDGAESLSRRQTEDYASQIFEPVIVGAAKELRVVLTALREKRCLAPNDAIGLFGFSAGGTAVLIALTEPDVPVRAAITVNAPTGLGAAIDAMERATKQQYVWSESARQLEERVDAIRHAAEIARGAPPRALLLFHGADDTIVVPRGAVSLREALQPYYHHAGNDQRLKLVIASGVSHGWTEPRTLQQLRASVADWFNRYL
jgi:pimeloyl-ACP methyl ester carboxylesterase